MALFDGIICKKKRCFSVAIRFGKVKLFVSLKNYNYLECGCAGAGHLHLLLLLHLLHAVDDLLLHLLLLKLLLLLLRRHHRQRRRGGDGRRAERPGIIIIFLIKIYEKSSKFMCFHVFKCHLGPGDCVPPEGLPILAAAPIILKQGKRRGEMKILFRNPIFTSGWPDGRKKAHMCL